MANIRQHGKGWQARVRRKGYPEQARTFDRKADAERWGRQTETAIDDQVFVPKREAEQTTLADLIDRYIREVTPLHKGGDVEKTRLSRLRTARLARYAIAAITPAAVAEHRDARLQEVSPGTVLRELQLLSALINHARKEWRINVGNAVTGIRKPHPNRARARNLNADEQARLLTALEPSPRAPDGRFKGGRNTWMKPVVRLALETAMRRGELLALRWEDVQLDRRVVFLRDTKNGDARHVPLSTVAVEVLRSLPRSIDGRIFPLSANALKLSFNRATRRAKIDDLHFHDLRHAATAQLATRLPNVIELATVTGHRDLRMLARYYHPTPEMLAEKLR